MGKQKFTDEEKENIKVRNAILLGKQNEMMMLGREREFYIKECLAKKGLDNSKQWEWNEKGVIWEKKNTGSGGTEGVK